MIDSLPDLQVISTHGTFNLRDLLGCVVVLYFYPKDNTQACTTEAIDFNTNLTQFNKLNTKVLGVSRDIITMHEKFSTKHELQFALIEDKQESLCNMFEVIKPKSMYGKQYMGIERSTFLFNQDGKLIHQWRKVKVTGHIQDVITTIKP